MRFEMPMVGNVHGCDGRELDVGTKFRTIGSLSRRRRWGSRVASLLTGSYKKCAPAADGVHVYLDRCESRRHTALTAPLLSGPFPPENTDAVQYGDLCYLIA